MGKLIDDRDAVIALAIIFGSALIGLAIIAITIISFVKIVDLA